MSNRLSNPAPQFFDANGEPLSGGLLFTYLTGSSTKTSTYSDASLSTPNTNPIVLDSAGRAGNVFLDPTKTMKMVLAPATDSDPPTAPIWTRDPVVDLAANVTAVISVYSGNPNGNVAGSAGSVGGAGASMVYDIANQELYVCTTTGTTSTAVWTPVTSGVSGDEDVKTGDYTIVAGDAGRIITANKATAITFSLTAAATMGAGFICSVKNIGAGTLTIDPDGAETIDGAATMDVPPYGSLILYCVGSAWRTIGRSMASVGKKAIWVPANAMTPRVTNGAATGIAEMTTNKNLAVTLDFDASTQEFAQFDICMPSSWNEGTVTFIPVWSHAATTTNFGVVWGLDAVAISNDDALDVAFGTAQTSADTGGTTSDIYKGPESSAITVAGSPAAGDFVLFRIHRNPSDGSDTMAIDARLHGIVLFITTDAGVDS